MAITPGTNSYVSEPDLAAYATERDITISGSENILLIKAMDYLETRRFKGSKTEETQPLEFPRDGDTEVPASIKKAQIVAALLIDSGIDLFEPIEQAIKRDKAGPVETEYQDGTDSTTIYPQLSALLSPYIQSGLRCYRG